MGVSFVILNTTLDDLPIIHHLFEQSISYQEKHGYPAWKHYDRNAIARDIENGHQFKVVINDIIAAVFSVAYRDKIIWRDRDKGDSIYLHRIVSNPEFKGQRLFGIILDWTIDHVKSAGIRSIRMDTWADNPTIISYYKTFGFDFVENFTTPDTVELPTHNRNLALTLLEYREKF